MTLASARKERISLNQQVTRQEIVHYLTFMGGGNSISYHQMTLSSFAFRLTDVENNGLLNKSFITSRMDDLTNR